MKTKIILSILVANTTLMLAQTYSLTTASYLNVRETPSLDARIVGKLKKNTVISPYLIHKNTKDNSLWLQTYRGYVFKGHTKAFEKEVSLSSKVKENKKEAKNSLSKESMKEEAKSNLTSNKKEANKNFYVEALYTKSNYSDNGTNKDFDTGNVNLVFGYAYNKYLAAQVEYSKSVSDYSNSNVQINGGNTSVNYKVDSLLSAFARISYPINSFSVNAYLGGSKIDHNIKTTTNKYSADDSSFSYGLGLNYNINSLYLTTQYKKYFKNFDTIGLGLGYKF